MKKIFLLGFGILLGTDLLFAQKPVGDLIANIEVDKGNPKLMKFYYVDGLVVGNQEAIQFLQNQDQYKEEVFANLENIEKFYTDISKKWAIYEPRWLDALRVKREAQQNSSAPVASASQAPMPVAPASKPATPPAPPVRQAAPVHSHSHDEVKSLDSVVHAPKTTIRVNSSISFETSIPDRAAWSDRCAKLKLNRHLSKEFACPYIYNVGIDLISSGLYLENIIAKNAPKEVRELAWQEFEGVMNACVELYKQELLTQSKWLNDTMIDLGSFTGQYFKKLILQPQDEVILHGDLHGDISSILQTLQSLQGMGYLKENSFELVQPNDHQVYMLFLGDYVDRGAYGVETMYTIMRLKLANPDKVFLVRGNHEDTEVSSRYKFQAEANQKLSNCVVGDYNEAFEDITRFYKYLPAAIFVGCANYYVQCCHGGIPKPGEFEPKALIESDKEYAYAKTLDTGNGYMWSDFFEENVEFIPDFARNRAGYGKLGTQSYLVRNNLKGILRAHQHSPEKNFMMDGLILYKGIFPLWIDKTPSGPETPTIDQILDSVKNKPSGTYEMSMRGSLVRTFNVSPDSWVGLGSEYYGSLVRDASGDMVPAPLGAAGCTPCDFDTCGIMRVQKDYTAWSMTTVWNQNRRLAGVAA